MRHFFSTRIRVVLVAALLIAVVLAVVGSLTGTNIPGLLVQGVLTPLRTGADTVLSQAEQIYDYIFKYEALKTENETLKQQLAAMEEEIREADSLARENERYRDLLQLKEAHEDYELVDAYIIGRGSVDWTSTVTINRANLDYLLLNMYENADAVDTILTHSRCILPEVYLQQCRREDYEEPCRLRTALKTSLMTLPCGNDTDARSVELASLDAMEELTVTGEVINTRGNSWYAVEWEGNTGFVYSAYLEEIPEGNWFTRLWTRLFG